MAWSGKLENNFSFSFSRFDTARSCLRKYFYSYYFHWNGWSYLKELEANIASLPTLKSRKAYAYMVKKATSKYLYAGARIHDRVDMLLKGIEGGRVLSEAEQKTFIDKEMIALRLELAEAFRKQETHSFLREPKTSLFFIEYINSSAFNPKLFSNPFSAGDLQIEIADLYLNMLNNVFATGWYDIMCKIRTVATQFKSEYSEEIKYEYRGKKIPIALKPDFLVIRPVDGNSVTEVFDWKSGKLSNYDPIQIMLYLYLLNFSGIDVVGEKVGRIFSWKDGARKKYTYIGDEAVKEALHKGLSFLESLLPSKDLCNNDIPDESEGKFTQNFDSSRFGCRTCAFAGICEGVAPHVR